MFIYGYLFITSKSEKRAALVFVKSHLFEKIASMFSLL